MTSGQIQLLALVLSFMAVVFIPLLVLLVRIVVKWTKVEAHLNALTEDMKQLVESKDRVHEAMLTQMGEDRKVTDRRLRWLEENLWKRNGPHTSRNV